MEFLENNQIKIDPPKKPKKLTATRFATVLGLNAWSTPFEAWCAITRTYEDPFEDSIYTVAGKIIEPKVYDYLNNVMFMDVLSPTDVYGPDYFKKTWGDFFPNEKCFGGMWDFRGDGFVVEVKSTKRAEDWALDVPIYYKLQAALYAYLLGFDDVVMTVTFLEDSDYPKELDGGKFDTTTTEAFKISYENTKIYEFKVSEAFPTFKESYIDPALKWWKDHVETGISPEFDEKKDAEILKVLRKNVVETSDKDIKKKIAEADKLYDQITRAESKLDEKKARLKELDSDIKAHMSGQFRDGDKKVELKGSKFTWTLTKSIRSSINSTKLKKELPDVASKYTEDTEVLSLKKTALEV